MATVSRNLVEGFELKPAKAELHGAGGVGPLHGATDLEDEVPIGLHGRMACRPFRRGRESCLDPLPFAERILRNGELRYVLRILVGSKLKVRPAAVQAGRPCLGRQAELAAGRETQRWRREHELDLAALRRDGRKAGIPVQRPSRAACIVARPACDLAHAVRHRHFWIE